MPSEADTQPTFRRLLQSAFAPFAVAGFLGTAAQLLDVSGWAIFALVVVGGAGVVVAHWRWKSSRWQSFTAGGVFAACAVGILTLALLQPPDSRQVAEQAPFVPGPSVQPVGPPDPNSYVSYDGTWIARKQACTGLLGLCFGQPISFAMQAFGGKETEGYPTAGESTEFSDATMCHAWDLPRIDQVTVCERNGAIYSIRVFNLGETDLSIAVPNEMTVNFGEPLGDDAEVITAAIHSKPFESNVISDEGASNVSIGWFFPQDAEGPPDVKIELLARIPLEPGANSSLTACSEQLSRYNYADVLPLARRARTVSAEISPVMPRDLQDPTDC
ncbi:hypothetical protein ACQP2Y_37770 [Actinoplanes sp. CA-051413]|uniref:hypothetical protein n=1 Tax=Actinoplanes sp. CA-051413 TaxID=3239899 RepID=UPI003D9855ED